MFIHRLSLLVGCVTLLAGSVGCESLHWPHELQPHRLWRLNRHPNTNRETYYSIHDNIPALVDPMQHNAASERIGEPTGRAYDPRPLE